jgi:hypothetical protein
LACRWGSSGTRPRTGRSNWWRPAKARSRSDSRPATGKTVSRDSAARLTAADSSTVLPMPASPSRTSTRLSAGGGSTSPRSRASSVSRPISPPSADAGISLLPLPRTPPIYGAHGRSPSGVRSSCRYRARGWLTRMRVNRWSSDTRERRPGRPAP